MLYVVCKTNSNRVCWMKTSPPRIASDFIKPIIFRLAEKIRINQYAYEYFNSLSCFIQHRCGLLDPLEIFRPCSPFLQCSRCFCFIVFVLLLPYWQDVWLKIHEGYEKKTTNKKQNKKTRWVDNHEYFSLFQEAELRIKIVKFRFFIWKLVGSLHL